MFGRRRRHRAAADAAAARTEMVERTVHVVGTGPHADAFTAALGSDAGRRVGRTVATTEAATVEVVAAPLGPDPGVVSGLLRSLGAGRALAIQAPWTADEEQLAALVDAQRATGVPVMYAEALAHAPAVLEVCRLVAAAGGIERIESRQAGPDHLGVAPFATAVALAILTARAANAGEITSVDRLDATAGTSANHDLGHEPTDAHRARIRFAGGAVAFVHGERSATRRGDLQASGATWVVRADLFPTPTVERNGEGVDVREPSTTPAELGRFGHVGVLDELGLALVEGRPPSTDAAFGAEVARVVRTVVDPSR